MRLAVGGQLGAPTSGTTFGWLDSTATVALLIFGYVTAHIVLRLLLGPTLGMDDAEQALFAQHWAWGYRFRQPPLFTWLLLAVIDLVGVDVLALSLLRYCLLGLTYWLIYLVARRWIGDRRLAALAVFSYALIYVFAYYAHHDLTHTTMLGTMVAGSFYAFARLVDEPSPSHYAALGACFGLGILAKWNFVMLLVGLVLTCLLSTSFRRLILSPWSFLTLAVMALVVSPTAFWMLSHGQTVDTVASDILGAAPQPGLGATLVAGTGALAGAILLFPMPFLPLFLLVFATPLYRGAWGLRTDVSDRPEVTPAFLGTLIPITLGLHWLLIPAFAAVTFTERWLHPALMILPVWLFALVERGRPSGRAITAYVALIAVFVALAFGARIARFARGADHCGKCREMVPFAELATELRALGFTWGTIVADGFHIGGNLRVAFPESRVIDPGTPLFVWPAARGDGMCLAVWRDDDPNAAAREREIRTFLETQLGVSRDAPRRQGRIDAPMYGSTTRRYALGYQLFPDGQGACR